jgi:hypothetical protein
MNYIPINMLSNFNKHDINRIKKAGVKLSWQKKRI